MICEMSPTLALARAATKTVAAIVSERRIGLGKTRAHATEDGLGRLIYLAGQEYIRLTHTGHRKCTIAITPVILREIALHTQPIQRHEPFDRHFNAQQLARRHDARRQRLRDARSEHLGGGQGRVRSRFAHPHILTESVGIDGMGIQ